jgi:ABC-2 type transport system ATP-binding protein
VSTPSTFPQHAGPAIEVEDLHRSFGETRAVDGLTLQVGKGEIVGLIGPDAAGKTTSMRIICGLLRPDQGRTRVLGFDSVRDARALKQHLGYMPQRFSLYPDLTVAENLRFFADMFGLGKHQRERSETRLMEFSQLAAFRSRRAGQLSGGMKQKLALSCTLIHTPAALVLDEPTTGVDPVSRREFWRILRNLAEDGLALLISTPYMDEADLCDRVLLMHHGRTLIEGAPNSLSGHFPRKLLSVEGEAIQAARGRLLDLDQLAVHRFGDRLHVVYDDDGQLERIRERVADLPVTVHTIAPSIEDIFVELTATERAEVAP